MVTIGEQGVTCGNIPDLYSTIIAGGGDILSIWRPRGCLYIIIVFAVDEGVLTGRGIPYLDCVIDVGVQRITTGRSKTYAAIRGWRPPCHSIYRATMSRIGEQLTPRGGLPYLHGSIPRTGCNVCSI